MATGLVGRRRRCSLAGVPLRLRAGSRSRSASSCSAPSCRSSGAACARARRCCGETRAARAGAPGRQEPPALRRLHHPRRHRDDVRRHRRRRACSASRSSRRSSRARRCRSARYTLRYDGIEHAGGRRTSLALDGRASPSSRNGTPDRHARSRRSASTRSRSSRRPRSRSARRCARTSTSCSAATTRRPQLVTILAYVNPLVVVDLDRRRSSWRSARPIAMWPTRARAARAGVRARRRSACRRSEPCRARAALGAGVLALGGAPASRRRADASRRSRRRSPASAAAASPSTPATTCSVRSGEPIKKEIAERLGARRGQGARSSPPSAQRYGEKILSSPTFRGFNWFAWMTPFAAVLAGAARADRSSSARRARRRGARRRRRSARRRRRARDAQRGAPRRASSRRTTRA